MKLKSEMKINSSAIGILMCLCLLIPNETRISGRYAIYYFILALMCLVVLMKSGRVRIPSFFKNPFSWIYYGVMFCLYLYHGTTLGGFFFLIVSFGIIFIMYNAVNNLDALEKILNFIVKLVVVVAVLSIVEAFTGFNVFDLIRTVNTIDSQVRFGIYRSHAMMVVTHNYSAFLLFAETIIMYMWLKENSTKKRKYYKAAYIIVFIGMMLTLTRASIAAFLVLQFVLGWLTGAIQKPLNIIKAVMVVLFVWIGVEIFNIEAVKSVLSSFVLMFMAMMDASTANSISSEFGINAGGVGQRQDLYDWILEKVKGNELLGLGPQARFSRFINADFTKTSIENQYLALIFRTGWIGMLSYVLFNLQVIFYLFKHRNYGEIINGRISLNGMMILTLIAYLVLMFTFSEIDEIYFINVILGLLFSMNDLWKAKIKETD